MATEYDDPNSDPSDHVLEYAPAGPFRRRRIYRRIAIFGAMIAIAIASIWKGSQAYHFAIYQWHLHQVRNYGAGANLVVYEEDPQKAAVLLAADPAYRPINNNAAMFGTNSNMPFTAYMVPAITRLTMDYQYSGQIWPDDALLAGIRRAPGGPRSLIAVGSPYNGMHYNRTGASPDVQVCLGSFMTSVLTDKGFARDIAPGIPVADRAIADNATGPIYARCYAGQPDPQDESHFTIRYEMGDEKGIIDGYLLINGKIRMHARGFGDR